MKDGGGRDPGGAGKLIIGQEQVIEHMLLSLFVGGNSLIIGVPGLAKTLLVHTLAQVLNLKFSRIQFTPDLMPSDITGTDIIQEDPATGRRQMVFAPGPIFANIVLADEINRTPPKTQAALLEAMQEHRVTIQGRTYTLEEPFFVFATQNPIELEGTYPLPEAQLDRFMFQIVIEHLPEDDEMDGGPLDDGGAGPRLRARRHGEDLIAFQRLVRKVPISDRCCATRSTWCGRAGRRNVSPASLVRGASPDFVRDWVSYGASVRAAQYLCWAARRGRSCAAARTSRSRTSGAGAAGAAPPHPDQLPRGVGAGHDRRRSSSGCWSGAGAEVGDVAHAHAAVGARPIPGTAVEASIRWCWRGSRTCELLRRRWWMASSTGCTARRTSACRWTSRSTVRTTRATTSAASTGGCTRVRTATT
jgi:MoxR-like ATPase